MKINVGRQAISLGLLVVVLTWQALAIVAVVTGTESFPGWLIGPTLAICFGWVASMLYREMEIEAVKGWKNLAPDPCSPLLSILGGIVNYDCDADSISDRKGPPYGWVPIVGGGIFAAATSGWLYHLPWYICTVAVALYFLAAGIEHPWLGRQMKEWPGFENDSSTELVVPAILIAWATIEFTVGTPLGVGAFWSALAGYILTYVTVLCCLENIGKWRTDMITLGTTLVGFILLGVAACAGAPWMWPTGYGVTVVLTAFATWKSHGLPIELSTQTGA